VKRLRIVLGSLICCTAVVAIPAAAGQSEQPVVKGAAIVHVIAVQASKETRVCIRLRGIFASYRFVDTP